MLHHHITCCCLDLLLQLLLRGSADAAEGVALEELRLAVGGATLTLRGSLLGRAQDASFALTDFPAVLLQPLFAALPALQVSCSWGRPA